MMYYIKKTYGGKGAASIESITVSTVTAAIINNASVNCFCILSGFWFSFSVILSWKKKFFSYFMMTAICNLKITL